MKIAEALMKENGLRLSYGNKWLVRMESGVYKVLEHKAYAKKTTILEETLNEDRAVDALLNDD